MARPRKGVTFDNANYIFWYLKNAYTENRLIQLLQTPQNLEEVFASIKLQPEIAYCLITDLNNIEFKSGRLGVDPYQLDQWVVTNINPKGWQRILSAYRQHRHARRHLKTSLKLNQDLYWRFSHLARVKQLSLDETMKLLLDAYED
jgi:hypothetical protein